MVHLPNKGPLYGRVEERYSSDGSHSACGVETVDRQRAFGPVALLQPSDAVPDAASVDWAGNPKCPQ